MTQVIKLAVESENRYADEIAERRLNRSKKEILTLAEQIKELKEITTNEFVNTNSKISKKR
jgi:DNA-binding helix-hairpin-helix protein with protein kinase domain